MVRWWRGEGAAARHRGRRRVPAVELRVPAVRALPCRGSRRAATYAGLPGGQRRRRRTGTWSTPRRTSARRCSPRPRWPPGPGPRDTPLRGALLTDAELDHTLGLMLLREGGGLRVSAPPAVLSALEDRFPIRGTVARYGAWSWASGGGPTRAGGVVVRGERQETQVRGRLHGGRPVGGGVPDHATRRPGERSSTRRACVSGRPASTSSSTGPTVVLLDGTFFSPSEMAGTGTSASAQRAMGHVPIDGPDGSLDRIRRHAASAGATPT